MDADLVDRLQTAAPIAICRPCRSELLYRAPNEAPGCFRCFRPLEPVGPRRRAAELPPRPVVQGNPRRQRRTA